MLHQTLQQLGNAVTIRARYDNFIGGRWVAPVRGQYFENRTPVTGRAVQFCDLARPQVRSWSRLRALT
jgi:aldehyde dehydrogenase